MRTEQSGVGGKGQLGEVLVINDSESLLHSLGQSLTRAGYVVDQAADGENGLALAREYDYQAIVLGLSLRNIHGLEILRRLREAGRNTHILILSAKSRVEDRVRGLKSGADDYLVRPFSFDELNARLQALVRKRDRPEGLRLRVGPLEIDTGGRQAFREGASLPLTPTEYSLLEFLARRRGRVASRDLLKEHLHPSRKEVSSNAIEVLISSLRKKIQPNNDPPIVETRRGLGYVIVAEAGTEASMCSRRGRPPFSRRRPDHPGRPLSPIT